MSLSNLAYQDSGWHDEPWEELIDGKIVLMSPRPNTAHNLICSNIDFIFRRFLRGKPCVPFGDGEDLYLSERDRFVPDGMIVCNREIIQERGVFGTPDLVVEVLSPSTAKRDLGYKFKAYERAGVREYWIISPEARSIEVHYLQDGRFYLHDVYMHCTPAKRAGMTDEELENFATEFSCGVFPDLAVNLDEVFERV